MRCDRVWRNARLATLDASKTGLGEVLDGLVACVDGRIAFAGSAADAPVFEAAESVDCEGRWITPGLIDPHTHLVYGGDRAHERYRHGGIAGADDRNFGAEFRA